MKPELRMGAKTTIVMRISATGNHRTGARQKVGDAGGRETGRVWTFRWLAERRTMDIPDAADAAADDNSDNATRGYSISARRGARSESARRSFDTHRGAPTPDVQAVDLGVSYPCLRHARRSGLDACFDIRPGLCPGPRLGRSWGPNAPLRSLAGALCAPPSCGNEDTILVKSRMTAQAPRSKV
jgi:hypothetical protein